MTHKELQKFYPSVFSAVHYDSKITVEIDHSDLSLDEVMDAFQTLINGMGYHNDAFKQWVLDRADEYREDEPEYDGVGFPHSDTYFVSNEEADEDFRLSLLQDEQRYESSVQKDYDNHLAKLKERGYITQTLLDYVDKKGAVTYGELHTYYKSITGSNSFSHVLRALQIPYKNRPTQRYLCKEGKPYSDAKYIVKLANPSNWVVVDDYDNDFKTFNEAPYGND